MITTYQAHPLRVQRRRTKGFRLPPASCSVTRPGKWGNCFTTADEFGGVFGLVRSGLSAREIGITDQQYTHMARIVRDIKQLRGFNLACFCPLTRPCHADVLAEWANR